MKYYCRDGKIRDEISAYWRYDTGVYEGKTYTRKFSDGYEDDADFCEIIFPEKYTEVKQKKNETNEKYNSRISKHLVKMLKEEKLKEKTKTLNKLTKELGYTLVKNNA